MKMKTKAKAFTLVELIIVIAIIAILAVSAFMVLTKWLWKSRDSRRLSDIGSIERALTTWLSDYDANGDGTLPQPTTLKATLSWGTATWYVSKSSYFDDYFTDLKNDGFDVLQKVVSDPNGNDEYLVAVSAKWKHFGVAAKLENDGSEEAAVRTNYQEGSNIKTSADYNWSGVSIIAVSDVSVNPWLTTWTGNVIEDGDTEDLPY